MGLALAIERQMQPIFGKQHLSEQSRSGAAAGDGMRGCRRLADLLAGATGELLAYMLDHLPLAGNDLQRLAHIFADLAQIVAAAARAARRRGMDYALARQMLRQRAALGLAPFKTSDRNLLPRRRLSRHLRLGLGGSGASFGRKQRIALSEDQTVGGCKIMGKRIAGLRHRAMESQHGIL